jgi:hypothetical protein
MEKTIKRTLVGFWTTKEEAQEISDYAKSFNITTSELVRQSIELHKQLNKQTTK